MTKAAGAGDAAADADGALKETKQKREPIKPQNAIISKCVLHFILKKCESECGGGKWDRTG